MESETFLSLIPSPHVNIIQDIRKRYEPQEDVIVINVIGSIARQEATENSDVDIEIVREGEKHWKWHPQKRQGTHIDLIFSTTGHYHHVMEHRPYFLYIDLDKRPVYDPQGFMAEVQTFAREYLHQHPEVKRFWDQAFQQMQEAKSKGEKPRDLHEVFDEAERRFSEDGKITRYWFRRD